MSDGTLGQYQRRASLSDALGDPARRATVDEHRRKTLARIGGKASVGSTRLGEDVIVEEEEISSEESGVDPGTRQTDSGDVDLERQGNYGTIDPEQGSSKGNKDSKRKPPPGRGESYFKEMSWE
ncbi:uncharacterized protein KY384_001755 [Bacidia gigantensis]|uniref:uncharacterized protein n=1 Tax=Bacidia gigantensis TaxID=2732470 RepID=UPI001D058006|nr:uncharacterized protein KY384_001755 [Bacidia gigantensis]KAG8532973.1 hypothetical protein KY384_001755 [Bacidia gigantensis]